MELNNKEDLIVRINWMCDRLREVYNVEDEMEKKEKFILIREQVTDDLKAIKESGRTDNIINSYKYGLKECLHYLNKANGRKIKTEEIVTARGKLQSVKYV